MKDESHPNVSAGPLTRLSAFWRNASLTWRFVLAGGVVMLAAMLGIGLWVTEQIEQGVVRNSASSAAIYVESFISPLAQQLDSQDTLDPSTAEALEVIFNKTPFGERILTLKIWKPGGLIAHANDPELIGQVFEPTEHLSTAWRGEIVADFVGAGSVENAEQASSGLPLLEIYSPVREVWTGRIIAVAEFYEIATQLEQDLKAVRVNSWLVVMFAMLSMAALLIGIVVNGSRTIERQQSNLQSQVGQLKTLAAQNEALRVRIERASARVAEGNERYLRKISADLHDGPAQLLAFVSLRLDSLREQDNPEYREAEIDNITSVLADAMHEIRDISRGLSLPQIEDMELGRMLKRVTSEHENRTNTKVALSLGNVSGKVLPHSYNICIFRFVQEGLANAYHHGKGIAQSVSARISDGLLIVTVSDEGPGADPNALSTSASGGLGLPGMQERAESLGGHFSFETSPGSGTTVTLSLRIPEGA